MVKPWKVVTFLLLAILLGGCGTYIRSEQPARPTFLRLVAGSKIGQTFQARFDGLEGVSVYLEPIQPVSGEINLRIFQRGDEEPIHTAVIQASEIAGADFVEFSFPPLPDSAADDFIFELTYDGPGKIKVGSAAGNTYLGGAQYDDRKAQNAQTTFRLSYDSTAAGRGLFIEALNWLGILAFGLFLCLLPGWAALSWLFPPWKSLNWISQSTLSIGLGLSLYPVLLLWLDTLGIQLNFVNALLLPISGFVLILIRYWIDKKSGLSSDVNPERPPESSEEIVEDNSISHKWTKLLPDLAFILLVILIFVSRFWPIRILDAPMWGDSYQHSMMAQLLVDNGGLFSSWEPYAQLTSFTYHFGFHTFIANLNWISGSSMLQSMLFGGQILNLFAVISLYPLAVMLGKNRWAGVIAVLIAGLISTMPMAYVNWGRYTQLASQVILPIMVFIIWKNLDTRQNDFRWNILVWLGLAGLFLTHYRIMIFMPLFYLAYVLFHLGNWKTIRLIIKISLIQAAGVLIFALPWIIRLFQGALPNILGNQISTAAGEVSRPIQELNAIGDITVFLPLLLWLFTGLAALWGIINRNKKSNIFSLWWIMILLAANPQWFRLPGTGILTNFAVFIAAYIPAGVLIGYGCADILARVGVVHPQDTTNQPVEKLQIDNRWRLISSGILLGSLVLIGIWYMRPRIRDVQPMDHSLLTRPDMLAAEWINENLPEDARFLVNSFFAYADSAVVGSDGGWWLPLITVRLSTQPPLPYVSEAGPSVDYIAETNGLIAMIKAQGLQDPDVLEELNTRGIILKPSFPSN